MRIYALFAVMLLAWAVPGSASPWKQGGALGPHTWPPNTRITIYILPDPTGKGRENNARDGILLLNDVDVFTNKGISFAVEIGTRPPGAQNAVEVRWQDGPPVPTEPNSNGLATPQVRNDPATGTTAAVGGSIILRSDKAPNNEILEDDQVGIVALHELLHLSGLAHEEVDKNDIMYKAPTKGNLTTSKAYGELQSLYNAGQASVQLTGSVEKLAFNDYLYSYSIEWFGGTELALFEVEAGAMASIWSAQAPPGWGLGPLELPSDMVPETVGGAPLLNVVTFQLADSTSYLGAANPFLSFSFHSNRAPAQRRIWLDGLGSATGPGSAVPEPDAWAMMLAGFAAAGAALRRRRGRHATA